MQLDLDNAIKKIYEPNDFIVYKEICQRELPLNEEFFAILKTTPRFREINSEKLKPGREWQIQFDETVKGNFSVHYETLVKITKIVPLFEIIHLFSVKNRDTEGFLPILKGRLGEAFCMEQFDFAEKIKKYLLERGYVLSNYYLDTYIAYMFENRQKKPLTVSNVLFTDAYTLWRNKESI
jgi:hypothetical protein